MNQQQLMLLLQQNRITEAHKVCEQLCQTQPSNARLLFLMSAICGQLGDFAGSESYCQRVIKLHPRTAPAWYNLGVAQLRQNKYSQAQTSLKKAISLQPEFAEALCELGNVLQQQGDNEAAIRRYMQALKLKPDFSQAHHNLALAQLAVGEKEQAQQSLESAIRHQPGLAASRHQLSLLFVEQGNLDAALTQAESAVSLQPDNQEYLSSIALLHRDTGNLEQSEAYYRRALSLAPENSRLVSNFALTLIETGNHDEAIERLNDAIRQDPQVAELHYNLGLAYSRINRLSDAIHSYMNAIELDKNLHQAWTNLGTLHMLSGKPQEAIDCFDMALRLAPDYAEAASNRLMAMNYCPEFDDTHIARQHFEWGARKENLHLAATPIPAERPPSKIRIGFVSPDFREHSVAYFFLSLTGLARRPDVEIICYSNTKNPDRMTQRIRSQANLWRDITKLSDQATADRIYQDRPDVLIDLAGHTSGNRLGLFTLRPCPVQITYLGYPNTSGLAEMDYRLTDSIADPNGQQELYTEKLLRMPRCFLCFTPPEDAPEPTLPGSCNDTITFGCFNNLAKITPRMIVLWSRILQAVPESRIVLKARPLGDPNVAGYFRRLFMEQGIAAERLELLGWVPTNDHYAAYNTIDIALDTFPYHGTTTTCEALWMGRPVITRTGTRHASRVGASLLHAMDMGEFVAGDDQQYLNIAIGLAHKLQSGEHPYRNIRQRMATSPLCDQSDFQQAFLDQITNCIVSVSTG
ncbi:O-linked N-acetylglucosamine transferase [Thiohalobacter thiocyanaticus]|uniref:protein O-GlcNAc transferase n=1 Tax=Thiohalobacter thiocyanaticus TaxID=585455 RepID=A0A1Z4VNI7_9GAMM|nr:tetratricopeptide repeat protein [Thiohalobacter thiocyanaticus]BAZ93196.1 O-linked N-acetylglucosamine transferase [Thiohalobacter thiocyanaticus]